VWCIMDFLGLHLCKSTLGISTIICNKPNTYPPKRVTSAATIILMMNFKLMHRWNPLCKGFMLSHFGRVCCVCQHRRMIHTIVRKSLVKYCKGAPKAYLGGKGIISFYGWSSCVISFGLRQYLDFVLYIIERVPKYLG
jgi:hypothetical protein